MSVTMMVVGPRRLAAFLLLSYFFSIVNAAQECERLQASLTYTQEEAPRDLSGVLPVVVERVNRVLEGVVDVEVEWMGSDLHGRVGEHIVQCRVTRLASAIRDTSQRIYKDQSGRDVATQCFHVPFSILDTNECLLPKGHAMRHLCHESAVCVNTIGSYECVCPRMGHEFSLPGTADEGFWERLASQDRSPWEVSFNMTSLTSCPSMPSTHGCCREHVHIKSEAATCRAAFRCPVDPCAGKNNCASSAECVRKASPVEDPNYLCQCPRGLMGNGLKCRPGIDPKPEPKVMYDAKTPTETTVKNNYYCDCTKPIIDACSGFPPCKGKHEICVVGPGNQPRCDCEPGYVKHEKYGCVDESPPLLRLNHDPNGDGVLRLKQGDVYKEYAVDIEDENAEEYLRSLKIAYSRPLPHGCLPHVGEFHVNYTIATPWTSPPFVRVTRRVIIEDIDECTLDVSKYEKTCPSLVPQCDTEAGATCVNTYGSYTCKCPKFTTGDGFKSDVPFDSMDAPEGFKGGTSCRDTSKPVIHLVGPNPKVFRVCECGGINGIMTKRKRDKHDAELKGQQFKHFDEDIKDLVKSTSGAELCATYPNRNPNPSDCVKAYDETYKGQVDLSRDVKIGEPVQKSQLRWEVPYDVQDAAGNAATTVWRRIIVEEVNIVDVENKIRKEMIQERDAEISKAVDKALEEDRKKRSHATSRSRRETPKKDCPKCPKCECPDAFDPALCDPICHAKIESCAINEYSLVIRIMLWLEEMFPPSLVPLIMFCLVGTSVLLMLRFVLTLLFNAQAYSSGDYYYMGGDRERQMQGAVTYYSGGSAGTRYDSAMPPPRASLSVGGGDSFFTPRAGTGAGSFASPPVNGGGRPRDDPNDIYESPPIITPSRRGDGVRRRSPYSRDR